MYRLIERLGVQCKGTHTLLTSHTTANQCKEKLQVMTLAHHASVH